MGAPWQGPCTRAARWPPRHTPSTKPTLEISPCKDQCLVSRNKNPAAQKLPRSQLARETQKRVLPMLPARKACPSARAHIPAPELKREHSQHLSKGIPCVAMQGCLITSCASRLSHAIRVARSNQSSTRLIRVEQHVSTKGLNASMPLLGPGKPMTTVANLRVSTARVTHMPTPKRIRSKLPQTAIDGCNQFSTGVVVTCDAMLLLRTGCEKNQR
jgi:hypothetical protein